MSALHLIVNETSNQLNFTLELGSAKIDWLIHGERAREAWNQFFCFNLWVTLEKVSKEAKRFGYESIVNIWVI